MGIVSRLTKRLDVPGETGQWVEIGMLSWLTLAKARKEKLKELGEMSATLAGLRQIAPLDGAAQDAAREAAAADPLNSYDHMTLLKHGITSWSYGEKINVEDLDERTAQWAAREIIAYAAPGEDDSKGRASPSTGT